MIVVNLTQEIEEGYKFYQNRECNFFPFKGNENACHPNSNSDTHSCLFCFCPLYALPPEKCPDEANPIILNDGTKDCSKCLYPHKLENYNDIIDKLKEL